MNITSISFSYFFLGIFLISIISYLYFKFISVKTSNTSQSKEKIIGTMKDPYSWKDTNIKMSFLSLFWSVISIALFVFFKFFYAKGLISVIFLFVYLALIVISLLAVSKKNKAI